MKSKLFRILGVVTVVSMLAAMFIVAPAAALTQPTVTITPSTSYISAASSYSIVTTIASALAAGDQFVVTFPAGTVITSITPGADADVQIAASSGIGTLGFPLANVASTTLGQVLTITVPAAIGVGATIQIVVGNTALGPPAQVVVNPATAGSYNLTVLTQTATLVAIEPVVTSAAYTISNPTLPGLPGIVQGFNSAGVLVAQSNSINSVIHSANVVTVKVGDGTYDEDVLVNVATITSISSVNGAATTIIRDVGNGAGGPIDNIGGTVNITAMAAAAIFDGFTIYGNANVLTTYSLNVGAGVYATIQNCTVKCPPQVTAGIVTAGGVTNLVALFSVVTVDVTGTALTGMQVTAGTSLLTSLIFNIDAGGTGVSVIGGTPLFRGCAFNGAQGTGIAISGGTPTIDGGIFTGLAPALNVTGGTSTIKNSTFDGCGNATTLVPAIVVNCPAAAKVTAFNNVVKNSPYYIASLAGAGNPTIYFLFNDFSNTNNNAKGFIQTLPVPVPPATYPIKLTHNWWGATTGPPLTGYNSATISATMVANPVGAVPAGGNVVSAATWTWTAAAASGLSASYFASQTGYVTVPVATVAAPTLIGASTFASNPGATAPITSLTVLKYFDVFINGAAGTDSVTVNFYSSTLTANAQVFFWDAAFNRWNVCSTQVVNTDATYGSYVAVTLNNASVPLLTNVTGSYFALLDGATVPGGDINMVPAAAAQNVSVTPSFSWTPVAGALGYDFIIADNPEFSVPTAAATTTTNGFILSEALDFNTQYWWKVTSYNAAGVRGVPITGTFKTMAEPVVTTPTTEPEQTITVIVPTQTQPDITVVPPAQTQAIPTYLIWIVIAVGAVLVIVVIVLIVRTRRIG